MYKIITAVGNEFINEELKKTQEYEILFSDIAYQEALLDIVKNREIDKILVYEQLPGELSKENFFEKLQQIVPKSDIIVIVDNLNASKKNIFKKYNIEKLIDSNELSIEILNELIKKEPVETLQNKKNQDIHLNEKTIIEYNYNKKIIVINGNNGSGKTTFAINLATVLSQNNKKRVLLIDLDTVTASIDKFLSIPKINKDMIIKLDADKECVLNYCTEYIQKNMFDFDAFSNVVVKYNKQNNLDIITGNTSMFVCQNVLCENYYNKIIEKAKEIYDYIVIDTNSCLFLDATKWALQKSDVIYYIMEGNYKDINNFKNNITVFSKVWDILLEKIEIVLNKNNIYSLNKEYIEGILNIKIETVFEYSSVFSKAINNGVPVVFLDKIIKGKYEKILGIKTNTNFLEKIKFMIGGNN